MIYTHVLNKPGISVISPFDVLDAGADLSDESEGDLHDISRHSKKRNTA